MSELSMYTTPSASTAGVAEVRTPAVLGERARNSLKTAVHHELLRRMDLERLAAIKAEGMSGSQRLLDVILKLIG